MSVIGRDYTLNKTDEELIGNIGFGEEVYIDRSAKRKVLLVGANSYIGNSFKKYAEQNYNDNFFIDDVDTTVDNWRKISFAGYDCVYHLAGIAHADIGNASDSTKEKYYKVNTDLAVEVAVKAKTEGVRLFVFMSSMLIYGESAPCGKKKIIDKNTVPSPANFYGDSKLQADIAVRALANDKFKVIVLRPPMIYGQGSKGNYPKLSKIANRMPIFPRIDNLRSMLYIGNLCEFLCKIMLIQFLNTNAIVLFPQNADFINTSQLVATIAKAKGHKIKLIKSLNFVVGFLAKCSVNARKTINKAFGNSCYSHDISVYEGIEYQKFAFVESIYLTENISYEGKEEK